MCLLIPFFVDTLSTNTQHLCRLLFKQRLDMLRCCPSLQTSIRFDNFLITSWTLDRNLISPCHRMAFSWRKQQKRKTCSIYREYFINFKVFSYRYYAALTLKNLAFIGQLSNKNTNSLNIKHMKGK